MIWIGHFLLSGEIASLGRHSRESGNPAATIFRRKLYDWIPAFAGMTDFHFRLTGTCLFALLFIPINFSFLYADNAQTEKVSFPTRDGLSLKAVFRKPAVEKPVVIMLHGLAAVKEEWKPLQEELEKIQWGYLAYDARGHGESSREKDKDGSPHGYRYFGPPGPGTPWERMIDDVGAAVQFLQKQTGIDRRAIFLAGASLGANVSLRFASLSAGLRGIVLLSPGLNYQGIETQAAIKKAALPVLIVASPADQYAHASSLQLKKSGSCVTLWTDVKPGHGVQMFDDQLLSRLIQWLTAQK